MEKSGSTAVSSIWNKLTKAGARSTSTKMAPSSSSIGSNSASASGSSSPVVLARTSPQAEGEPANKPSSPPERETTGRSATAHYKFGDLQPMPKITKSPYEPNQTAEVDEPLFDRLKLLLLSKEERQGEVFDMAGSPSLTVQDETNKIFGEVLAEAVVKAHYVIGKSGILFSPPWLEHKQCKIRGVQCGWISKPMMLLLLHEQRFARAPEVTLSSLINSIGVLSIFFEALKEWKLDDPQLVHNEPSLHFNSKKQQCLKCVIFIARVYRCSKVLRTCEEDDDEDEVEDFEEQEPGLFAKVQQCLEILKENVKVHPKRLEEYEGKMQQEDRRKQYLLNLADSENSRRLEQAAAAAGKPQKKRKRASTGTLTVQSTGSSLSSNTFPAPVAADDPPEDEVTPPPPPSAAAAAARRQPSPEPATFIMGEPATEPEMNGNHHPTLSQSTKSVDALLALTEKQFKIMGKSMKRLRREIKKNRDEIREEVRAELMEEYGLLRRRDDDDDDDDDEDSDPPRTSSTKKKRRNGRK